MPDSAEVDLSHHLSTLSKSRHASPLKDIIKYMYEPGMTSLAGGLPHPSLFPFKHADIEVFDAHAPVDPQETSPNVENTHHIHLSQFGSQTENTLSKAMQYTGGTGDLQLTRMCRDFVKEVYKPRRTDFEVILSCGNTDAWAKTVQLLCEPGEHILVEQFVYPSAQHFYIPMGCKGVPVDMDGDGIIPESLEETLKHWEISHPGARRPHVIYQVPVGHNPCGSTLTWERKRRVYDLAVQYDLIIVEDDPYYWLQFEKYHTTGTEVQINCSATTSLVPSFLQLDYQGRVIRLETFSKTIAPGLRLGYFVASPLFTERLLRATEVSSQAPSGWSQAILLELLKKWGTDGYLAWLKTVKEAYCTRRNWMCDALMKNLNFGEELDPEHDLIASVELADGRRVPALSFVPPKAGMFIWVKLHLAENPAYKALRQQKDSRTAVQQWSHDFWLHLIERKVLLTPGSYYEPWQGPNPVAKAPEDIAFFRLAFSYESREDIEAGIEKLAQAVREAWRA